MASRSCTTGSRSISCQRRSSGPKSAASRNAAALICARQQRGGVKPAGASRKVHGGRVRQIGGRLYVQSAARGARVPGPLLCGTAGWKRGRAEAGSGCRARPVVLTFRVPCCAELQGGSETWWRRALEAERGRWRSRSGSPTVRNSRVEARRGRGRPWQPARRRHAPFARERGGTPARRTACVGTAR